MAPWFDYVMTNAKSLRRGVELIKRVQIWNKVHLFLILFPGRKQFEENINTYLEKCWFKNYEFGLQSFLGCTVLSRVNWVKFLEQRVPVFHIFCFIKQISYILVWWIQIWFALCLKITFSSLNDESYSGFLKVKNL